MLAFAPSSSPNYAYAPATPSPLSPRSVNIHGLSRRHPPSHNHMNDEQHAKATRSAASAGEENRPRPAETTPPTTSSSSSSSKTPFAQRPIKQSPFRAPSALHHGRRNAYWRKVANLREESRYESRGEDMMRLDFMQRQRAWEAEREREAALAASDLPEEEEEEEEAHYGYDLPVASGQRGLHSSMHTTSMIVSQDAEVEEFVRDEGRELEALLEHMPQAGEEHDDDGYDDTMKEELEGNEFDESSLWSDDADYEALFSEVISQQEQAGNAATAQSSQIMQDSRHEVVRGDDEMDMS